MPPWHVVSGNWVNRFLVNRLVHDHQVPTGAGISENDRPTGRSADVGVRRILEYFFDLLLGDVVFGAMPDVAIGIVVQIPDDRIERHEPVLLSCGIIVPLFELYFTLPALIHFRT